MATIAELFDLARRHHRSGNFQEAEPLYRQVIQADPTHAEAHYSLGLLAHQAGQQQAASMLIRHAIALKPTAALFHFQLGLILMRQGQSSEAALLFRQVLLLNPLYADAHFNLGKTLKELGHKEEAIASYRQALRCNPQHALAYNNLGNALKDQGQTAQAIACYRQALVINPNYANAWYNLGNALKDEGTMAEAVSSYREALKYNPQHADAYNNLGTILKSQEQLAEATASFRQAISLNPNHGDALKNLGILLNKPNELKEAIHCFRRAVGINPGDADAHYHLGLVLSKLGQFQESLLHTEEAIRLNPRQPAAYWLRALLRLLQGDFENGWKDYERRWDQPQVAIRAFSQPRWDGFSLEGKTLLIYAEQGFGDTIQFLRYLPLVKQRGGTILFECLPPLVKVIAGTPGIDGLYPSGAPLPHFDFQVPLLSLPGIFKTTLANIPSDIPYLRADPNLVEFWKNEIMSLSPLAPRPSPLLKVGIVWQGSPKNSGDPYRSVPLTLFEPLARLAGVRLLSLQIGPGAEKLNAAPFNITDLGSKFNPHSMADLASVLVNLDLVVTVDTLVAHMAGALGRPVWVALPLQPDWRWLLDRSDSPWYPSMRLFRQKVLGEWQEVFERLAFELRALIAARTA